MWRFFCMGAWPTYAGFREGEVTLRAFAAGVFASALNSGVWGQIVSWYRCCWADRGTLWLTYEDLSERPARSIQQLAEFLLPDLQDVLSRDPALLERVQASTTKEAMLQHKEQFDDHFVLSCLDPFRHGDMLNRRPYVNKVQPPLAGAPGGIRPDGEIAALLDGRWAHSVEPATGFRTYAELRAAIGGRANWTGGGLRRGQRGGGGSAAEPRVPGAPPSRGGRAGAGAGGAAGARAAAALGPLGRGPGAAGAAPLAGEWPRPAACGRRGQGGQGGLGPPRGAAAPPRRGRGRGGECAGGELQEKAKGWHAPSRAAIALGLGLALVLAVALAFWGLTARRAEAARSVKAARALCQHWHPEECRAPLAELVEGDRAALVVSCFNEDLRWLEAAPRGRGSAWRVLLRMSLARTWVYMHNHTGQQAHLSAFWSGGRGGGPRVSESDAAALRAELEDAGAARFVDIPNVGDEATAYLRFLVDHYDALPEAVVFSHGHQSSQKHARFDMAELLRCLCTDAEPGGAARVYRSLNSGISAEPMCFRVEGRGRGGSARRDRLDEPRGIIRKHWAAYFAPFLGAAPPAVFCMDCCAQFLVSRKEVQAHPRALYETLLAGVLSKNITGLEMEIFWRLLFVGPEERDPAGVPRRARPRRPPPREPPQAGCPEGPQAQQLTRPAAGAAARRRAVAGPQSADGAAWPPQLFSSPRALHGPQIAGAPKSALQEWPEREGPEAAFFVDSSPPRAVGRRSRIFEALAA
ncbi:unnamed protein product [Prorocentrum cordatum]|uniref:Protein-tyrosine sulfotransferase n=1 Tax=Prorocentrum cordatum TaxID=2364126 RepID=A0ABN9U2A0_9DINO|nr:unnamed protein product [Polarella glacialis]